MFFGILTSARINQRVHYVGLRVFLGTNAFSFQISDLKKNAHRQGAYTICTTIVV